MPSFASFPGCFAPDGLYTYMGMDEPEQTEDGRPGENTFENNQIEDTTYGTKIRDADNTIIVGELKLDLCSRFSHRLAILRRLMLMETVLNNNVASLF